MMQKVKDLLRRCLVVQKLRLHLQPLSDKRSLKRRGKGGGFWVARKGWENIFNKDLHISK